MSSICRRYELPARLEKAAGVASRRPHASHETEPICIAADGLRVTGCASTRWNYPVDLFS